MGLAPEEQNALTLAERAEIVTGLGKMEPAAQVAAVMALGRAYGDQAGTVAADLAETGLSLGAVLAADPSGGPSVTGRLARAAESQGEAKPQEGGAIEAAAEKLIAERQDGAELPFPPLRKPKLPFNERVEVLGERPNLSLENDTRFSRSFATPEERAGPRSRWMVLSGTKWEQLDKQLALLRLPPLEELFPEENSLSDEEKELAFNVVQMVFQTPEGRNARGGRAEAIRNYIAAAFERINPPENSPNDLASFKPQRLAEIADLADVIDKQPFAFPIFLAREELEAGLGMLVEKLKKSGDDGLALALIDFAADFVPGGKIAKKLAGVGLNLIGVVEAMDTQEASKYLLRVILEMQSRGMIRFSSQDGSM